MIVSLPGGIENKNYETFSQSNLRQNQLQVPVVLCRKHGMLQIAAALEGYKGLRTGILNPSDAQAVRQGFMGMYWTGWDIAVEELIAVQTTLLLQHCDVNENLWKNTELHLFKDI